MQAEGGDAQIIKGSGLVELGQNQADAVNVQRFNARFTPREEELLQLLCAKLLIIG